MIVHRLRHSVVPPVFEIRLNGFVWAGSRLPETIPRYLPLEGKVRVVLQFYTPYPHGEGNGYLNYENGRLSLIYFFVEVSEGSLNFNGEDELVLDWVKKVASFTRVTLEITDRFRTGYVAPEWLQNALLDSVDRYPYKHERLKECWAGDYWWRRLLEQLRRGGRGPPERFDLRLDRISSALHFEVLKYLPPETVATVKFDGGGRVEYGNGKLAVTADKLDDPLLFSWVRKFYDTFAGVTAIDLGFRTKDPIPPSLQQLARYRIYRQNRPDIVSSLPDHAQEILFP